LELLEEKKNPVIWSNECRLKNNPKERPSKNCSKCDLSRRGKSKRPRQSETISPQKKVLEEYFRNMIHQFEYWEGDLISDSQFKEMERIAGKELNSSMRKVITEVGEETIHLIEQYIHSLRYKKGGIRRQKVPIDYAVSNLINIWQVVTGERTRFRMVRGKYSIGRVFDFIKYFLQNCLHIRIMLFPKKWQEDSLFPDIVKPLSINLWSDVSIKKSILKETKFERSLFPA
jgi:hypothetical protein